MSDNSYINHCIECDVTSCKHHNIAKNFCSFECIKIGTHESDPEVVPCTDCQSFEQK